MVCKHRENCSFFKTFSTKQSFVWKAMIKNYCELGQGCERRNSYEEEGVKNIPAELMPTGTYASKAFRALP